MEINIEQLRYDLMNYFGSSASFYPAAFMDVIKVQDANDDELINIAYENGFDINDYVVGKRL